MSDISVWQRQLPGDLWLVGVRGRLDQSLNSQLEEILVALLDEGNNRLIVDLAETTYINSGGLRCLVSAWRRARREGGSLVLSNLNSRLQEIFSMIGFDKVFQIFADSATAQAAMNVESAGVE